MRVLCITDHSDRPEAETFIGLHQKGVDLTVICPATAPHYRRLIQADVPVIEMKLQSKFDRRAIGRIRETIMARQIRILHLFNNNAVANGLFASRGLPVKIIAYRGIEANISFFNPASWMTHLHPRVDRIVCVAEKIRTYFLNMRLLRLRVPPNKPITIHKGHSLDWYNNPPADLAQFGIPKGAFTVCCTANYRPRKGIPVLLAATRFLADLDDTHLLLVGDMNAWRIRQQIRKSPMAARIHLAGFRTDAPEIAAACDVAILPALRREGLPKVIIEAMAYGTAPIVTDSGGSPELIEEGVSGFIISPNDDQAIADKIRYLYQHPDLCRQIGRQARQRINTNFRIKDTIEKTHRLYRELLQEGFA